MSDKDTNMYDLAREMQQAQGPEAQQRLLFGRAALSPMVAGVNSRAINEMEASSLVTKAKVDKLKMDKKDAKFIMKRRRKAAKATGQLFDEFVAGTGY